MKEDRKVRKPATSSLKHNPSEEELCQKARETLDKANRLLAESGKKLGSSHECQKEGAL